MVWGQESTEPYGLVAELGHIDAKDHFYNHGQVTEPHGAGQL